MMHVITVEEGFSIYQACNSLICQSLTPLLFPRRVNVSNLEMGRPRLEKSRTGEFIPVYADQPSSVIAYRHVMLFRAVM